MRCLYHNIPDWTNQYTMQQKSYNILSQNHNAEQAKTLNVVPRYICNEDAAHEGRHLFFSIATP